LAQRKCDQTIVVSPWSRRHTGNGGVQHSRRQRSLLQITSAAGHGFTALACEDGLHHESSDQADDHWCSCRVHGHPRSGMQDVSWLPCRNDKTNFCGK